MRKIVFGFWIILLVSALIFYFLNPALFTVSNLVAFFKRFETRLLLIYMILSIARGVVLLPSTPFVLAGLVLFPDSRFTVFALSLFCIGVCASLIYFFAEYLELDKLFGEKYSVQKAEIATKINTNYGVLFVTLWSFFPFAPTDLVCYVAGVVRMNFFKFMLGVLLGEAIICGFYVFMSEKISTLIN
jgi:uncharacterized membrane protein YdjX (TVP38/TMEM64 family)